MDGQILGVETGGVWLVVDRYSGGYDLCGIARDFTL